MDTPLSQRPEAGAADQRNAGHENKSPNYINAGVRTHFGITVKQWKSGCFNLVCCDEMMLDFMRGAERRMVR